MQVLEIRNAGVWTTQEFDNQEDLDKALADCEDFEIVAVNALKVEQ